jgi:uncharacterized protein (TIRG00374 family)
MSDFSNVNMPRTHGKKVHKGRLSLVFRCVVTVLIIAYLVLKVHWPELVAQLVRADFFWLILACFLFGVVYLLAALRWWFLMQVQEIHLPLKVVTALTFIGQFFNSFLLGAVGGDIIKAVYIHKYAPNQKTHATLSIIMDRVLGLLILVCASLLVIPWQFQFLMRSDQAHSVMLGMMVIFGLCGTIGVVMIATPVHRIPPGIRAMWHKIPHWQILELVIAGFRQHGIALKLTLASLAAGTVMTAVLVAACYCIGVGIGLTVTYMQMLVIITVVICVISLPISIGGHGVREGIFLIMFTAFGLIRLNQPSGADQETAILFSLLFFAIPLVWSLVGGIVYLSFRHDYELERSVNGS